MDREGDNYNDEYYVRIKTISGRRIVNQNCFEQSAAIALCILTCQCIAFLQTSRPGSIETTKNELANVSVFNATIDHMDLISRNSDDGYINLAEARILAAETSQKDNLYLGKAMKADDREVFMKAMEKRNKRFGRRRCLRNTSKVITSKFNTYNPINMGFQEKN